jgi:hypothetical protein
LRPASDCLLAGGVGVAKCAAVARMSLQEFRGQFEYLIANELPPLEFKMGEGNSV